MEKYLKNSGQVEIAAAVGEVQPRIKQCDEASCLRVVTAAAEPSKAYDFLPKFNWHEDNPLADLDDEFKCGPVLDHTVPGKIFDELDIAISDPQRFVRILLQQGEGVQDHGWHPDPVALEGDRPPIRLSPSNPIDLAALDVLIAILGRNYWKREQDRWFASLSSVLGFLRAEEHSPAASLTAMHLMERRGLIRQYGDVVLAKWGLRGWYADPPSNTEAPPSITEETAANFAEALWPEFSRDWYFLDLYLDRDLPQHFSNRYARIRDAWNQLTFEQRWRICSHCCEQLSCREDGWQEVQRGIERVMRVTAFHQEAC